VHQFFFELLGFLIYIVQHSFPKSDLETHRKMRCASLCSLWAKRKTKKEAHLMNKYNSIFGQILSLFPRLQFETFIQQTHSSKRIKGFNCWDPFVSMIFRQLSRAHALREICEGLANSLGKMVHLGMKKAPGISTSAYANEHRPWKLYPSCPRMSSSLKTWTAESTSYRKAKIQRSNPLIFRLAE
jgi:hypothetical protein